MLHSFPFLSPSNDNYIFSPIQLVTFLFHSLNIYESDEPLYHIQACASQSQIY